MERSFNIKVDEKNRVVVVTKKHIEEDIYNKLWKFGIDSKFSESRISDKIVAVARCHPDDAFDPEIGKNIAIEKYKNKYRSACIKALTKVIEIKSKEIEKISEMIKKYQD